MSTALPRRNRWHQIRTIDCHICCRKRCPRAMIGRNQCCSIYALLRSGNSRTFECSRFWLEQPLRRRVHKSYFNSTPAAQHFDLPKHSPASQSQRLMLHCTSHDPSPSHVSKHPSLQRGASHAQKTFWPTDVKKSSGIVGAPRNTSSLK